MFSYFIKKNYYINKLSKKQKINAPSADRTRDLQIFSLALSLLS